MSSRSEQWRRQALLSTPGSLAKQFAFVLGGATACAFAAALYVGAQLGPAPRDGLMTGLVRRTGWSIRRAHTTIEMTVLAVGLSLGDSVGPGAVVFDLGVGLVTQFFRRYLMVPLDTIEALPGPAR